MKAFVGTSGWYYDWNEDRNLDWFVKNSGLNSVELNASFYRFPYQNQVKGWAARGKGLRWSVKVHRLVTHQHRFNDEALKVWGRFRQLFAPLDEYVDYYLFQAHPKYTDVERILKFAEETGLCDRFAFEIRNKALLGDDEACKKLQEKMVIVSVDSPDYINRIFRGKVIYLRMHGRGSWYQHDYSEKELKETVEEIRKHKPKKAYVYFNNDHSMLDNARTMLRLLGD